MVDSRKENLLKIIVEEYIKAATPISSSLVAEKYLQDLSSATVRNYMADLEQQGLIYQPHTSAGRVPTILGYRAYIEKFVGDLSLSAKKKKELDSLIVKSGREGVKDIAKKIADLAENTVLVAFSPADVYYTGISNLFRQPEFVEQSFVYSMSEVIDHFDEVMGKIFHFIKPEKTEILLGKDNPFGDMCSLIIGKYLREEKEEVLAILGPSRMNYRDNLALLSEVKNIFKQQKI